MGKRIFRINPQEALLKSELIEKELHLVLRNNEVFFGILKNIKGHFFVCENKCGKTFQIPDTEIREIVYDQHSSY